MGWFDLFGIFVCVMFCKPTSEKPAFAQSILFTHIKEATKTLIYGSDRDFMLKTSYKHAAS